MESAIPFTACLLGAAALFLMLRPGRAGLRGVGAVLGLGALGWLLAEAVQRFGEAGVGGAQIYFYAFAGIAVIAAVRVVTHSRPVFSALYFIGVILSSAAMFLLLEAEFLAFALVIVYAGAILITYMFVLMLAQQASSPDDITAQSEYDVIPREPATACVVAFIMLAMLSTIVFEGVGQLPEPPNEQQLIAERWDQLEQMPGKLAEAIEMVLPDATPADPPNVRYINGEAVAAAIDAHGAAIDVVLPAVSRPQNVQSVGLALVADFPASLELAGVILLMAMFGAVILARRQIELGEDELRVAAGMQPMRFADDEPDDQNGEPAGGGATS